MQAALQFLDLVERELRAQDAKLELGGRPPSDVRTLVHELDAGWRLVVSFEDEVGQDDDRRARLAELVQAFSDTLEDAREHAPRPAPGSGREQTALHEALLVLAEQAGADGIVIFDHRSPAVWAAVGWARWLDDVHAASELGRLLETHAQLPWETLMGATASVVEELLEPQELSPSLRAQIEGALGHARAWKNDGASPARIRKIARAMHAARQAEGGKLLEQLEGETVGLLVRPFGGIYRVALMFGGAFNQLQAEARLLRALPAIDRLVADLPPLEPPPKGGRIFDLRRV